MKNIQKLTHEVAVNAYLIHQNKFLLLCRSSLPQIWGPPGGRLSKLEDPIAGLRREVYEETGLKIEVLEPVTTWFGKFNKRLLLSIDYLCCTKDERVALSPEHTDFRWLTLPQLREYRNLYCTSSFGFQLKDYEKAWHRYEANLM